jgi:hypothetical protein
MTSEFVPNMPVVLPVSSGTARPGQSLACFRVEAAARRARPVAATELSGAWLLPADRAREGVSGP